MKTFNLHTPFQPAGSQPEAIAQLSAHRPGKSLLLGVTGSGKTYTIAQVIASQHKPVLVLSPNKTLAAQLYEEFSSFFPKNKVCYFVSYYDYYQPESYLPAQDIYIPKETKINSEIERLRIESTASLINRPDTIVVASVSSIYSLGNPTDYKSLSLSLKVGQTYARTDLIRQLVFIQYERNEIEKKSGSFQVLGNTIEIQLPYQKEKLRIELFGDVIEGLSWVDKMNNKVLMHLDNAIIFPAKHFVTTQEKKDSAMKSIQAELEDWASHLKNPIYQERIKQRVSHDLEMLQEVGYCSGIENYSVHFDGRKAGEPPYCLFDFLDDFLLVIDESHITIPQLKGMFHGDRSRKQALIEFGFRLPSAKDNRPLTFQEIERYFKDVIFVSATPGEYERAHATQIVEQIIRPTGLLDPIIKVQPRQGQMDHLIAQIKETKKKGYRSLVMVLTKKLAEQLAVYLEEQGIKVCYLHSELKTPKRTELLQKLRLGLFDCLVGVNLLREGIDIPEVALVAIMDADVESFLRDERSLIQIVGRAARNTESIVYLYADKVTKSMKAAMHETERRRSMQKQFNEKHGIIPQSVKREIGKTITNIQQAIAQASARKKSKTTQRSYKDLIKEIMQLEQDMQQAAENLDFEKAIALRDTWQTLKEQL